MPLATISNTVVRSISVEQHEDPDRVEKFVRYVAKSHYKVGFMADLWSSVFESNLEKKRKVIHLARKHRIEWGDVITMSITNDLQHQCCSFFYCTDSYIEKNWKFKSYTSCETHRSQQPKIRFLKSFSNIKIIIHSSSRSTTCSAWISTRRHHSLLNRIWRLEIQIHLWKR